MLMRPLISPTAMKACQQADNASCNSDVAPGRGPDRAKLVKAINPRFRSTGLKAAEAGHVHIEMLRQIAQTHILRFGQYYHGSPRARLIDYPPTPVIFLSFRERNMGRDPSVPGTL